MLMPCTWGDQLSAHREYAANDRHEVGDELVEWAVLERLHNRNWRQIVLKHHGRYLME